LISAFQPLQDVPIPNRNHFANQQAIVWFFRKLSFALYKSCKSLMPNYRVISLELIDGIL
jgi:hypothetical protein